MNIREKVMNSFSWRQSDKVCAERIGIDVESYRVIKNSIIASKESGSEDEPPLEERQRITEFSEDIEKGTGNIEGVMFTQPRSAKEIEEALQIDTNIWKLSQYWNKEHKGYWLVSALVTRKKQEPAEHIKSILDSFKFKYIPSTKVNINKSKTAKTCGVLSLQDIHVGKQTIMDYGSIQDAVRACVEDLILRSYNSCHLDKVILVLGGDLVNMDTYTGTTTAGTPVENSMPAYDAYRLAFDIMFWVVNYIKEFCNTLDVLYIPGNHSRLTEAHIAYALSKCIVSKDIRWDIEYAERKVVTYGKNMFCFEHGDYDIKKSPLVFATEFSIEWGSTLYRTLYTGHYHKRKKIEYITQDEVNGFIAKILPSLSGTDMYHYSNKWTNNRRGGMIELHSVDGGSTGELYYYQ